MTIMVNINGGDTQLWVEALRNELSGFDVQAYPVIDKTNVHYAVVWHHPHDDLLSYPNLRAVLVHGAGMDHIDQAPCLPDVPIVRLVDPAVGDDMAQYVLYWVMHFQRGYGRYRQQQQAKQWQRYEYPLISDFKVALLGAGQIAEQIAEVLALIGFPVNVWSRTQRQSRHHNIQYFSSQSGLDEMLSDSRVLVNCLPLKAQTIKFVNTGLLTKMPTGGYLINVSRGAILDESAIIEALASGRLNAAALDTFEREPLSSTHPFWSLPSVYVTPHMSGATFTRTATKVLADNIRRVENGEAPFPIYHPPQLPES